MASDELVALLKQGVDAWNECRIKNPSGANLRKRSLSGGIS
jgi:hypothetical protein